MNNFANAKSHFQSVPQRLLRNRFFCTQNESFNAKGSFCFLVAICAKASEKKFAKWCVQVQSVLRCAMRPRAQPIDMVRMVRFCVFVLFLEPTLCVFFDNFRHSSFKRSMFSLSTTQRYIFVIAKPHQFTHGFCKRIVASKWRNHVFHF